MDNKEKNRRREALKEPYPKNLFLILKEDRRYGSHIPIDNITEDIKNGLEFAITSLPVRDQRIIKMRYKDKMTYSSIAKEFDLSVERIRTLEHRALVRLMYPQLLRYLKYGLNGYKEMCAQAKAERENQYSADKYQIRIIEMDIGIRAQNRLIAKGYEKVKDIIDLTDDEINNIRALGKKSRADVALALKKLDINSTAWSQYLPKGE